MRVIFTILLVGCCFDCFFFLFNFRNKKCIVIVLCRYDRTQNSVSFEELLAFNRQLPCINSAYVSISVWNRFLLFEFCLHRVYH